MDSHVNHKPVLAKVEALTPLAVLLDETERMLALAQKGEWEALVALEAERGPRLEAYFDTLAAALREQYRDQLRRAIEYILNADKQIIALGEATKAEAVDSLRQSQSARKASAAYQRNDGL
ncbi:hypothetical protein Tel_05615 [Candidatus Tenderia electrophaga]|jgi:hypothetical protein|uniref:Flagellar protein FliT n=1 Tax=Candidatus Tenderia electrophaga TaxID=1748243 RepID=A0A0S2TBX3_9GAMM|nr:hypothetical protein Tel_05615 [Candidatus Tenderia electrophaga]